MLCLVHFYDEWKDFRLAEMAQLLNLFQSEFKIVGGDTLPEDKVFLLVELASEDVAVQLCNRAVLIKNIYEVLAHAGSFLELVDKAKEVNSSGVASIEEIRQNSSKSWCMEVQTYGRVLKKEEKDILRDTFSFFDLRGPVVIKHADTTFTINIDFSKHRSAIAAGTYVPESVFPDVTCYFGRVLGRGVMKDALKKYHLEKRLFLGPTTLDHTLSMIMCNLAGVRAHHLVLDPFVGTASILIAASHLGAHCTGTDIDIRVLKGGMYAGASRDAKAAAAAGPAGSPPSGISALAAKRDIFANFQSYNLPAPELVRLDLHSFEAHYNVSHMSHNAQDGWFDVLVTDPPYGIRAGGRKSGRQGEPALGRDVAPMDAEQRSTHIPATQSYPVEEVMLDLVHAAARLLVVGGSLCYLLPTPYNFEVADLPQHPCLRLDALCLQGLSTRHGRHAVLLRKHCVYTPALQQQFADYSARVLSGQDIAGFGSLKGKLEAALAPGAHTDDAVVKRKSRQCEKRQASKQAKKLERLQRQGQPMAEAM